MIRLLKERLGQIGVTHANVHGLDRKLTESSNALQEQLRTLRSELDSTRVLAARMLIADRRRQGVLSSIADAEFRVFSQFGDDGIIQYLIDMLEVTPETFIEFGVEDYRESNTRFLLLNNNWRGLVIDGSEAAVDSILAENWTWRHDLTAKQAFISRDNINELIAAEGFSGNLGLLSVDIDGNDYWVWEAITVVDPLVVVCEYNSAFGCECMVTIPYEQSFVRSTAHSSCLYYGASLAALCHLAEAKGYAFVGCNSAGNNAYFVKRDRLGPLRSLTPREGFVNARFREARMPDGSLALLSGAGRLGEIAEMDLYDLDYCETRLIRNVFNID